MKKPCPAKRIIRILPAILCFLFLTACSERSAVADAYDLYDTTSTYLSFGTAIRLGETQTELFAADLCVGGTENSAETFEASGLATAEAVFLPDDGEITYAKNIYERRYPASTTKILTAYLALKYGDLDQTITVSETALSSLPWDASLCNLHEGYQLTLRDALYGLMLVSGNDAANVIAETISGSQEAFAELMNEEAAALGATHSHFVNANGLSDDDHYTTVYDLYLIFSAAIQNEDFVEIISTDKYHVTCIDAEGNTQEQIWENTNAFLTGEYEAPSGVRILGGKTGTTEEAGCCLVLYSENAAGSPVISIVLGAETHSDLYDCMEGLLTFCAQSE